MSLGILYQKQTVRRHFSGSMLGSHGQMTGRFWLRIPRSRPNLGSSLECWVHQRFFALLYCMSCWPMYQNYCTLTWLEVGDEWKLPHPIWCQDETSRSSQIVSEIIFEQRMSFGVIVDVIMPTLCAHGFENVIGCRLGLFLAVLANHSKITADGIHWEGIIVKGKVPAALCVSLLKGTWKYLFLWYAAI